MLHHKTHSYHGNCYILLQNFDELRIRLGANIPKQSRVIEGGNTCTVEWEEREIKRNISLEEIKNELINAEKSKILNMYSMSHYDKVRRSISIKFFK